MVVLGLIDQLRQLVQKEDKKVIGRPKGSKSVSKFDLQLEMIVSLLKEGRSVSEIARQMNVSRSSLKDYVESRELKALVQGVVLFNDDSQTRAIMMDTIQCPSVGLFTKESE